MTADDTPATPSVYAHGDVLAARYELSRVVGEGGMGVVWCARDLVLRVDVAVKIVGCSHLGAHRMKRLAVEARAAASVRHPGVVVVSDVGTTDRGDPFLVMELLTGLALDQMLDERIHLEPEEAVRLMVPLLEALATAHDAGVIHRDIKPANILITRDGDGLRPKLLDFGIARIIDEDAARLTVTGSVLGTPHYMSYEQASGKPDTDPRTDIWGICAVLYEMVTGELLFDGDNYNAVITAILLDERSAWPEDLVIDPELRRIIERGVRQNREARWSSAWALRDALVVWLLDRGEGVDATGRALSEPAPAHDEFELEQDEPADDDYEPGDDDAPRRVSRTLLNAPLPPARALIDTPIATTQELHWSPVAPEPAPAPRWHLAVAAVVALGVAASMAFGGPATLAAPALLAQAHRSPTPSDLQTAPPPIDQVASPPSQATTAAVTPSAETSAKPAPPKAAAAAHDTRSTNVGRFALPLPERPRF